MSPDRRDFLAGAASVAFDAAGLAALGALPADAAPGPVTVGADPCAPKHEMRCMWIASVVNIDWPSAPGLSPAAQKAEPTDLYDLAVARGMNTVVLQVRPTADAFWPSPYEPWSKYLTGTQGEDPGYDPLAFAVHAANASATCRCTRGSTRTASAWTPTSTPWCRRTLRACTPTG